jgi:hypothetical protein
MVKWYYCQLMLELFILLMLFKAHSYTRLQWVICPFMVFTPFVIRIVLVGPVRRRGGHVVSPTFWENARFWYCMDILMDIIYFRVESGS